MDIQVENLGKKYGNEWIFRNLNAHISQGSRLAITGSNGSGKSTLLKILSGFLSPSEGNIQYHSDLTEENPQLTFCLVAPYLHVISELTVSEFLAFHKHFKKTMFGVEELMEKCHLSTAKNRLLSELSSGMLQRLKLALAFFFEAKIVFLDEPTTNLDSKGITWYNDQIHHLDSQITLIIASNQEREYEVCTDSIDIEQFKKFPVR